MGARSIEAARSAPPGASAPAPAPAPPWPGALDPLRTLGTAILDPDHTLARTLYHRRCSGCHGATGGGSSIAPALNDADWLHGGSLVEIARSVREGFPAHACHPGGFKPAEVRALAVYFAAGMP
ncbi:MAG: c-type cytochrome [Myxococcales bacterium]|nr:c-type cytochrome [Myxococcales bacterium]